MDKDTNIQYHKELPEGYKPATLYDFTELKQYTRSNRLLMNVGMEFLLLNHDETRYEVYTVNERETPFDGKQYNITPEKLEVFINNKKVFIKERK